MVEEIRAQIGEGVTVMGPESLIREAMDVPHDVLDVPLFLSGLVEALAEDIPLQSAESLLGSYDQDDHPALRWQNTPDGPKDITPDNEAQHQPREPHYAPGMRVWDVGTCVGPWVLIQPTTLKLPVELPPEPDAFAVQHGRLFSTASYREVKVCAWVVETGSRTFQLIPEACLTNEAPLQLTDTALTVMEQEAADEAAADLNELEFDLMNYCAPEIRDEIKNLRATWGLKHLVALLGAGAVVGPAICWVIQNIR